LHVINHALFKGLLFLGAGAIVHATGTREIDHLGGLLKRMPWTGATSILSMRQSLAEANCDDLSGAWPGWLTWHNSAVYDGGTRFPGTGAPLPSIHDRVLSFLAAGIPAAKLGVGIDFYGYVWNGGSGTPSGGVTGPRQSWEAAPWVKDNVAYSLIMDSLYKPQYYRWDTAAQAAYLSIDNSGSSDDKFVSYDDDAACRAKIAYVRQYGLGGVILWELGGGWRPSSIPHDPLLQAVRSAVRECFPTAVHSATRKER